MKRIFHYLILALILIGIPVLTAGMFGSDEIWNGLLNFPPRTEDWGLIQLSRGMSAIRFRGGCSFLLQSWSFASVCHWIDKKLVRA